MHSIPIEYYEKYLFPSFWLQVHILYLENTREALEAYLLSLLETASFISAKFLLNWNSFEYIPKLGIGYRPPNALITHSVEGSL